MNTHDRIYLDLRRRLPAWLFHSLYKVAIEDNVILGQEPNPILGDGTALGGPGLLSETIPKDIVFGPITRLAADLHQWQLWIHAQTYIEEAEGPFLDLHGADRATHRHPTEPDHLYRDRVRRIPDQVTEDGIRAAILLALRPGFQISLQRPFWITNPTPQDGRRAYWRRTPFRQTAPDTIPAIDVFTLRYRLLAFGRPGFQGQGSPTGAISHRRRAWRRRARWARSVLPIPVPGSKSPAIPWQLRQWRTGAWSHYPRPILPPLPNPQSVAVVLLPPLVKRVNAFWRQRQYWRQSPWGAVTPDHQRYRAVRNAAEAARAAGIEVQIWIRKEQ